MLISSMRKIKYRGNCGNLRQKSRRFACFLFVRHNFKRKAWREYEKRADI